MRGLNNPGLATICMVGMILCLSCREAAGPLPEATQEEISSSVPELSELHEVVYPLWHTAFPNKDFSLIKELLPQMENLAQKLDEAELPGILREKQPDWNRGKQALKTSLEQLQQAVDNDHREEMLKQTEAFHAAYEQLVRTIRPVVAELEAFHQELYKLYHYHHPNDDLEAMQEAAAAMQEKMEALRKVQLPGNMAARQAEFDEAVGTLESELNILAADVRIGKKKDIAESVEKVHTAYQNTEKVFN